MKWYAKTSILLTLVNTAVAGAAHGATRCSADLARVDTSFCIDLKHKPADGAAPILSYKWQANDATFDLAANLCLAEGAGNRRDLVLALDRSDNRTGGVDQIVATKDALAKLRDEAISAPQNAPKVAVVLFSTDSACNEYSGAPISISQTFPCLYTKGAVLSDDAAYSNLIALLDEAAGKYSAAGQLASSDYRIPASLAADGKFGLASPDKASMVLLSDALSYQGSLAYQGTETDPYAYLRTQNYLTAQSAALIAFAAQTKFILSFGLNPINSTAYSQATTNTFYSNSNNYAAMCNAANAVASDCNSPTNYSAPETWPVNQLDLHDFAKRLVAATGGAADLVFDLNSSADLVAALEKLRISAASATSVTAVAYQVGSGAAVNATLEGQKMSITDLPTGQDLTLNLTLSSLSGQVVIPVAISTESISSSGADLTDKEMFCSAEIAAATDAPHINLDDLQGGSGSCGRVPGTNGSGSLIAMFMLFAVPVAFPFLRRRKGAFGAALLASVSICAGFGEDAMAVDAQGLNLLQYRPVIDGAGNTEKATTLAPGQFAGGIFMDYANDAAELSGNGGKRVSSVMDNSVTAHAVAGVGLTQRFSLGIHMPYIQKNDLNRSLDGNDRSSEKIGRPSDASVMVKANITNSRALSFGVMPMATIPTGEPKNLTGDGTANYGLLLVTSGESGAVTWAASAGYLHRSKPAELTDDRARSVIIRGQVPISLGLDYQVLSAFSFGGNVQMKPSTGESLDFNRTDPAEWSAIGKTRILSNFELEGGFGTGIGKGIGSPDYRIFAGITYVPVAERQDLRQTTSAPIYPKNVASKAKI